MVASGGGVQPCPGSAERQTASADATVRPEPSSLAQYFGSKRNSPSTEEQADAGLEDFAETALLACHETSELHRPDPARLEENLPQAERLESLVWLLQTFAIMRFSDAAVFETLLVLDRYHVSCPRRRQKIEGESQRQLLAAVCLSLKMCSMNELMVPLRKVVNHMAQKTVAYEDVVKTELSMLKRLKFCVGTPTALEFLMPLKARLEWVHASLGALAEFLLHLTLAEVFLHYSRPHAVLAASAAALALHALDAPASAYAILLEDLSLYSSGPGSKSLADAVVPCCASIHDVWLETLEMRACPRHYAHYVCAKFAHPNRLSVSSLPPPPRPPSSLPPEDVLGGPGLGCGSRV